MRRGEVWLLNLDPTPGTEIKKTRPEIRSVAQERVVKKLGELSEVEMESIAKALAIVLVI